MRTTEPAIEKIDFSHEQTSDFLLPQPAIQEPAGNISILNHQPQFDTPEHEANWHVIAYCPGLQSP